MTRDEVEQRLRKEFKAAVVYAKKHQPIYGDVTVSAILTRKRRVSVSAQNWTDAYRMARAALAATEPRKRLDD